MACTKSRVAKKANIIEKKLQPEKEVTRTAKNKFNAKKINRMSTGPNKLL